MEYTENYHLPKRAIADRIQMADFNGMTSAIDTALAGHDAALTAQQTALTVQAARTGKLGNCQVYTTTYIGNSSAASKTLPFPHRPMFVMVMNNSAGFLLSVQGLNKARLSMGGTNYDTICTWSGNSFSWDTERHKYFSESDKTYYVVALLDAAQ